MWLLTVSEISLGLGCYWPPVRYRRRCSVYWQASRVPSIGRYGPVYLESPANAVLGTVGKPEKILLNSFEVLRFSNVRDSSPGSLERTG